MREVERPTARAPRRSFAFVRFRKVTKIGDRSYRVGLWLANAKLPICSDDATLLARRTWAQRIMTRTGTINCAGISASHVIDHGKWPLSLRLQPNVDERARASDSLLGKRRLAHRKRRTYDDRVFFHCPLPCGH